jgi:hypothetical protein
MRRVIETAVLIALIYLLGCYTGYHLTDIGCHANPARHAATPR